MKLAIMTLAFGLSAFVAPALASDQVLVTCVGLNQSTRNYSSVDWRADDLTATPKRQYLTFPTGSPLLLAASKANDKTVVTIKGGLFEFDKNAIKTLPVLWNSGSTATAEDTNGNYETVTCYFQH